MGSCGPLWVCLADTFRPPPDVLSLDLAQYGPMWDSEIFEAEQEMRTQSISEADLIVMPAEKNST